TVMLRITELSEEKPMDDLLKKDKRLIENGENLIIDVRINNGGNDEFYFLLLKYIFDEQLEFKDLFSEDEAMYTNYTKRNCDLWIETLEEYLEQELEEENINTVRNEQK